MSTGDRNAFELSGGQPKSTTAGAPERARLAQLRTYLRGLPSLDFTVKGRANVCRRFGVAEQQLLDAVATLQRLRPSAPSSELLRIIGAAVAAANTPEEGQPL